MKKDKKKQYRAVPVLYGPIEYWEIQVKTWYGFKETNYGLFPYYKIDTALEHLKREPL